MSASLIIPGIFLAISIAAVLVCFIGMRKKPYSRALGASSCVYASACLFVFLIGILREGLPMLFFILAGFLTTMVYVIISMMILVLMKQIESSAPKK